jgi:hypothetical protein
MPSVVLSFPGGVVYWQVPCRPRPRTLARVTGKGVFKPGRSLGAQRACLRRGSSRGSSSQEPLLQRYVCGHVLCGKQASAAAATPRQPCKFISSWALDERVSAATHGYSAHAHTAPRCARVGALILACLQGDRKKHLAPFVWG